MIKPMINELILSEGIRVAIGGAVGALAKDMIVDNALELPFKKEGKLYLGFIGAVIVGAVIGYVVDGSFVTAVMGGYTGKSVLEQLLVRPVKGEDLE